MWLNLTENRYTHTILHEFGHALGLRQEHQHEEAPPLYDEHKLREYLKEVTFGSNPPSDAEERIAEVIRKSWGRRARDSTSQSRKYDKNSIMHFV